MKMELDEVVRNLRCLSDCVGKEWGITISTAIEELEKGHHVHYHLAPNHTVKQAGQLLKIEAHDASFDL